MAWVLIFTGGAINRRSTSNIGDDSPPGDVITIVIPLAPAPMDSVMSRSRHPKDAALELCMK